MLNTARPVARKGFVWVLVGFVGAAIGTVCPARGDFIPGTGTAAVTVQASNGQKSCQMSWEFPENLVITDTYVWSLPSAETLYSGSEPLATLTSLHLQISADPQVQLNFALSNPSNTNTNFTIMSAGVFFGPMVNPDAFATAAITVTDGNGDGVNLTGLYSGTKAYEARYNMPNVVWANLVDPVSAGPDDSDIGKGRRPASGWEVIPATVSSVQSEFRFTLSGGDQASGTSKFEVIPEPATFALLICGGWALARRRRK